MNDRADLTFGLNPQALAILHMLAGRDPEFADYENGHYDFHMKTFPWYNGRERGICLVVSPSYVGAPRALHIAFGEDRRSDAIFVDVWEDVTADNGPTLRDASPEAFEEAYQNRKHFNYGQIGQAVEAIFKAMELYYETHHAKEGSK